MWILFHNFWNSKGKKGRCRGGSDLTTDLRIVNCPELEDWASPQVLFSSRFDPDTHEGSCSCDLCGRQCEPTDTPMTITTAWQLALARDEITWAGARIGDEKPR